MEYHDRRALLANWIALVDTFKPENTRVDSSLDDWEVRENDRDKPPAVDANHADCVREKPTSPVAVALPANVSDVAFRIRKNRSDAFRTPM
jgi:hypothetical protein